MSIFQNIVRSISPNGTVTVSAELSNMEDMYMRHRLIDDVTDELVRILAKEYAETYGPEILKALQQKTVDAKLIQKVIENLRKELKNETPDA